MTMSEAINFAQRQDQEGGPVQGRRGPTMDVEKNTPPPGNQRDDGAGGDGDDPAEDAQLERWNASRTNVVRFGVTLFGFVIMGMNDAVLGVSDEFRSNGPTPPTLPTERMH